MIREERAEILRELLVLSIGQRKVLNAIAGGQKTELTGRKVLNAIGLSGSYVTEVIQSLEKKGYIEQLENGEYRIIDPLIKSTLLFHCGKG